jgi:ubiquinone biosynthesis protein UbiJ
VKDIARQSQNVHGKRATEESRGVPPEAERIARLAAEIDALHD